MKTNCHNKNFATSPRFQNEVQSNSEMAYSVQGPVVNFDSSLFTNP